MSILQTLQNNTPPDLLAIGHVTRDLLPDGSFSLGGTVTYSALTASRLGLKAAIVTCADRDLLAQLPAFLPGIDLSTRASESTTTFANYYQEGFRTQYVLARADQLRLEDIPADYLNAPVVLFGPLVQELTPTFIADFPRRAGSIIAATPQGWLRRWDEDGRVWPTPWAAAEQILPLLDVLILSHDDLLPFANGNRAEANAILYGWSLKVPLLVATDGRHGATLFQYGQTEQFPAYPALEIDPTGAGDVFAAAFLTHFYRVHDPRQAIDFANCVASLSIEHAGTTGIPSLETVKERLK